MRPSCVVWLLVVAVVLGSSACSPKAPVKDAQLQRGDTLLAQGHAEQAIPEYERALKGPAHDDAVLRLASAYEALGDYVHAETYLTEAAKAKPTDPTLRLALARNTAVRGNVRKAFAMTKSVSAASPTNLEALLLLAALATAPDEVSYATGLLRAWHGDDTKRAEHMLPSAETWLPLAALYDRLHEGESAAVARAEAKRVGLKNIGLALNLANVYFSLERLQPAEELLLAATKALPDRASSWLRLAAVQVGLRKWQDASASLAHLPAALKNDFETASLEARVLLGLRKADEAEARLRPLLQDPKVTARPARVARVHFLLANVALARDDNASAANELRAAESADPDFVAAPLALAELHLASNDPKAAVAVLTKLTARKPDEAAAFKLLGQAQLQAREPALATRAFERFEELQPADANGPLLAASALEAEGKGDEAQKQIERAIALAPGSAIPVRQLVTLMSRRGKLADAENRVRIELARRGRNADLLTLLGDVLAAGVSTAPGKRDAAEQAYREAAALDPQSSAAWLGLGNLYADSGEAGRAELMYAEALKLQPDLPEASLRLAKLHLQQGAAAEAAKVYEAVLERHPQFVPALNNLAYLYSEQLNDPKRALVLAESAANAAPDSANAADTLGWILHQQGQSARALPLLARAAKGLPDSAEAHYHLGMALLAARQVDQGKAELREALRLSVDFAGAAEAKRALGTR